MVLITFREAASPCVAFTNGSIRLAPIAPMPNFRWYSLKSSANRAILAKAGQSSLVAATKEGDPAAAFRTEDTPLIMPCSRVWSAMALPCSGATILSDGACCVRGAVLYAVTADCRGVLAAADVFALAASTDCFAR